VDRISAARYLAWSACTAAAAFALVWLYVAMMPMAFLSRDYPLWLAKKAMIDKCDLGSVALLGDSRAVAAVMPTVMPLEVSNLALSSSTPIETYFAVARMLRCNDPPKLVVIAHGPGHFSGDASFWDEGPTVGYLGYRDLADIADHAALLGDHDSIPSKERDGLPSAVLRWLYNVRFPPIYFASLLHGYGGARFWHNEAAYKAAVESRGQALFGTGDGSDGLADESSLKAFRVSALEGYYFTRTLALLASRHIETFFIAMPMNQSTHQKLARVVRADMLAYLHSEEARFTNFHVIGDPVACWPDRYFGDAWHFNRNGAAAFSRELGSWLVRFTEHEQYGEAFRERCGGEHGTAENVEGARPVPTIAEP
jgi:hypothetical protein